MKIALFANTDWYLYNFRLGLARALREAGHEVLMLSPTGRYKKLLEKEFLWREIDLGGGSRGVLKNIAAVQRVRAVYRELKPDLVHHFTIKCVLFGGLAARLQGIPAVHAVTGLGHVFTDDRLVNRMARPLVRAAYRQIFRGNCQTIFQNEENRNFFLHNRLVEADRTNLIRGSGANCERFQPSSEPRAPGPCRFLFASRLLREKGVIELMEAFKTLRSRGIDAELLIAGELYPDNPSSLNPAELEAIKTQATYLGHVDDMRAHFRQADVIVLPSYAEGTPRVLLEAGACGKPLIATDIAGCRGVVVEGKNGFLVPARDSVQLATAMERLAVDASLRECFGKASREIIVAEFSESEVIRNTIAVYCRLKGIKMPPIGDLKGSDVGGPRPKVGLPG